MKMEKNQRIKDLTYMVFYLENITFFILFQINILKVIKYIWFALRNHETPFFLG